MVRPGLELKPLNQVYMALFTRPPLHAKNMLRIMKSQLFTITIFSIFFKEFQVYVYFRQQWFDKRLAHKHEATLALGGTDVERIWLPDTYITNANDYEVFPSNQLVLIDSEGKIYYFAYVRIAGACQMNLVKFPMDVQRCHLTLESCK